MPISTKQLRAQLEAAYVLMEEDTTTLEKIEKLKILLTGINPALDSKLNTVFKVYGHLRASLQSDIVHLSLLGLPETTAEEKKRKKALILFITSWKSLKSEVARVRGYYANAQSGTSKASSSVVKTGLFAKGPFGLITLAAVAIVGVGLLLRQATTTLTIENIGCPPIEVPAKLPFPVPGLRLPESPITSGAPAFATLPALLISVRSSGSTVSVTVFGQTGSYTLPGRLTDVRFNNASLLNQTTQLQLGSSRTHNLTIKCK